MSDPLKLDDAKSEIEAIILEYEGRRASIDAEKKKLTRGKLYELFVLGRLLKELKGRGFSFSFVGKVLELKQGPGKIQPSDGYFSGYHPASRQPFRIYTDIEVRTLGSLKSSALDDSAYHEIDIVAVDDGVSGNPTPDDLLLGVECKSTAKFAKAIVKETLGIKREISLLCGDQPSRLALLAGKDTPEVPSEPPVEYWLVYCDPKGNNYRQSPKTFGVEYREWKP
ncbi:hypothetical protein LZ496_05755 [Sphingomonas sp. NSE70-1]|uniref:Restriction endonuclease n=1 Tax=Sphingomonas caseinilyticus TaxID=2908205 RepID=A0ABT0RTF4_9SPHN|nr:hypothetical protein [Sphingomonas caseinilyticus]MCL6698285.1 hypothetical protein [Sphingomonas caseinilyticus]